MGVWDWFRHRWHPNRRVETPSHGDQSWPFTSCFNTRGHVFPMIRSCPPPKCLSRLPCSQILLGERVEDFSSDCWLENHLHRFGGQPVNSVTIPDLDTSDDSVTGSSEEDNSCFTDSGHNDSSPNDFELVIVHEQQRLPIEDLFLSPEERDDVIDSPSGYRQVIEPPPYCDFSNDPPPTYAEAIGQERDSGGSISSGHLSIDSTFLW